MDDIIKTLTEQLGIGAEQAQAGVGAILKVISEQASRADFQQLLNVVPGAAQWMGQATMTATTATAEVGGSLLGQAAQLIGGLTGNANLADSMAAFGKSGIGPEMLPRFVPSVLQLLQAQAGADLIERLVAPIPFLREALGGGATGLADALGKMFR
jgi:hypothetical protein